jgi:mxaJ protein
VPLTGGNSITPPAQALADRGIVGNIVGYSIYTADYRDANPSSRIVRDAADDVIDAACVWGPLGGYFASRQKVAMDMTPVASAAEASTPFAYSISVGVKRGNAGLKRRIDEVLERRQAEIDRILDEYRVPRLPLTAAASTQPTANGHFHAETVRN